MSDPLYAKDLLRLAAAALGAGRLSPFDAEGTAHNPTCGDKIGVTLRLDDKGHVTKFAHETHACVLTQASASILGAHLLGANVSAVRALRKSVTAMLREGTSAPPTFKDYKSLSGAATFRNRHACVLLPIDAVLDALK